MLGTKPHHDAYKPSRNLDNLAATVTEMMWAIALGTTRIAVASTVRSLELWSQMVRAPVGPCSVSGLLVAADRNVSAKATATSSGARSSGGTATEEMTVEATAGETSAFATYRSSSGHAAALVTQSD